MLDSKLKRRLHTILGKIENDYKRAGIDRRKTGEVRIEMAMNLCLKHIEELNSTQNLPSDIKRTALEYGWSVYMDLQNFDSPVERVDIAGRKREFSLDTVLNRIKVLEEAEEVIHHGMFSGGTGYRSVNWDAEYWMAETKAHAPINEYWNEEEAKKKRPVKVYTKEELKKFQ